MYEDQILLLDKQTKFNIERMPSKSEQITNGFKIYEIHDNNLNNLYVVTSKNNIIPLNKYDKCVHLIHSGIYNDKYYILEEYNDCYKRDFRNALTRVSVKIGARSITLSYNDDKEYYRQDDRIYTNSFQLGIPTVSANVNLDINNSSSQYSNVKNTENFEIKTSKKAINKEQFYEWIEKEKIDLKAFDNICFSSFLDEYEDFGKIGHGVFSYKDAKIVHTKNAHDKNLNIKLGFVYLPAFIGASFAFGKNNNSSEERKAATELKVYIEF